MDKPPCYFIVVGKRAVNMALVHEIDLDSVNKSVTNGSVILYVAVSQGNKEDFGADKIVFSGEDAVEFRKEFRTMIGRQEYGWQ